MRVEDLSSLGTDATIDTDLVIIGGGPAGLTIAREFFGTSTRVLIVESGKLVEDPQFTDLNAVESVGEPKGEAARRRIECHGPFSPSWSNESQTYGVRCRVLGGSSQRMVRQISGIRPRRLRGAGVGPILGVALWA